MSRNEAINQLEDLRCHCIEMAKTKGASPIWMKDVKALDMAIKALEPQSQNISYSDKSGPDCANQPVLRSAT